MRLTTRTLLTAQSSSGCGMEFLRLHCESEYRYVPQVPDC